MDMLRMTTTRLPHTDYYLTIRRARNSQWQREWENNNNKLHYIKPHIKEWKSAHNSCRQYEVKLSRICIGHTRLTHGLLMSRNKQQLACGNTASGNQRLTTKHCLKDCSNGGTAERNTIFKVTYGQYLERNLRWGR